VHHPEAEGLTGTLSGPGHRSAARRRQPRTRVLKW
jgi:hypothetical protein